MDLTGKVGLCAGFSGGCRVVPGREVFRVLLKEQSPVQIREVFEIFLISIGCKGRLSMLGYLIENITFLFLKGI